jgi:zinc/manganese transport system ATP-binding protein
VGTPDEVLRSEVLSYMYDTPVEVIRSRGRVAVLGAPEGYGVHDHLEHHARPSGVLS